MRRLALTLLSWLPMWGKRRAFGGLRPRADKIHGPSFRTVQLVTTRSIAVKDAAMKGGYSFIVSGYSLDSWNGPLKRRRLCKAALLLPPRHKQQAPQQLAGLNRQTGMEESKTPLFTHNRTCNISSSATNVFASFYTSFHQRAS